MAIVLTASGCAIKCKPDEKLVFDNGYIPTGIYSGVKCDIIEWYLRK